LQKKGGGSAGAANWAEKKGKKGPKKPVLKKIGKGEQGI